MKLSESVKDYSVTKSIVENYKVKLTKVRNKESYKLQILFDDGDVYASFEIKKDGKDYWVYEDGELINEEMDFTQTLDECIKGCLYRFYTMY